MHFEYELCQRIQLDHQILSRVCPGDWNQAGVIDLQRRCQFHVRESTLPTNYDGEAMSYELRFLEYLFHWRLDLMDRVWAKYRRLCWAVVDCWGNTLEKGLVLETPVLRVWGTKLRWEHRTRLHQVGSLEKDLYLMVRIQTPEHFLRDDQSNQMVGWMVCYHLVMTIFLG